MGAKASTPANSGHQSPRTRTFSSSSSTEVASPPGSGAGFNVLRALPGIQVPQNDRQRARSLSSVPDLHQSSAGGGGGAGSGTAVGIGTNNNNNSGSSHNHHHHHHHHHPHLVGHNDRSALINRGGSSSTAAVVVSSGTSSAIGPGDRIIYGGHSILLNGGTSGGAISLEQVEEAGLVDGIAASVAASASTTGAMGRVYTATSLPSHIWSLNGIKCPVCSKFVLPDDIECHLVMCLTKPRLSYNEDVLTDAKGECVICLEELNPGDVIARLPCLCVYHKGCIDRWFEVNRSCPEHPGD